VLADLEEDSYRTVAKRYGLSVATVFRWANVPLLAQGENSALNSDV